jgi:hypothetical protein
MAIAEKIAILSTLLDKQVNSFGRKRADNKRNAFVFHLAATALSAAVTVMLGWQGVSGADSTTLRNAALLFSAIATLLGTWDAFFTHRALWVRYTSTVTNLLALKSELEFRMAGEKAITEEDVDHLYSRAEAALSETNVWWLQQRSEESRKTAG